MNPDNFHINLDEDLTDKMTVNKNLSQNIIVTNTDKLTILLNDHHKIIKKKREWLNPLGIFATAFTALLTTKFEQPKFGISPEGWKSIFTIASIVCFILSVYYIINAIWYRNLGTVDEFIRKLKNEDPNQILLTPAQSSISTTSIEEVEIISATYLWSGGQVDVTDTIKNLFSNGIYSIMVDYHSFGIPDPAPNILKTLKIHCKINGEERGFSKKDGETLSII